MNATYTSNRRLLLLTAGYVVWSAAFLILYSALSVGCELGWQNTTLGGTLSLQRLQLVGIYLLHLLIGLVLVLLLRHGKPQGRSALFLHAIAFYTAIAAVASTAFTFAGTLILTPC